MNVLSLFDGCSCGRVALERAGIPVDKYYASEVDKYAIQISKKNYPDIEHIGDVRDLDAKNLEIDLLLGGSPCQGFSFAGKRLNFDDPRSKLFFEYVRILKETKPKWFLLENVRMNQASQDVISEALGVQPVEIDSARVSAQSRKRLYWTNITMPTDWDIVDFGYTLSDILECGTKDYIKSGKRGQYKKNQHLASTLTAGAHSGGNHSDMDLIGRPIQIGEATDTQNTGSLRP
jgi:DNA (cytosine-5)-methyltransferase 3A